MHYEADAEVSRTAESLAGLSLQPKPNPLPLGHKRLPSYLSRDFHPCPWPKENDSFGHLGDVSTVSQQEQLLLRDLLYVLIGIEGKYIRLQQSNVPPRYNLTLDPSTDRHLVAITNQILVIPPCYSSIVAYVESRVYGQVNQALVAAMQRHLFDYNMLVGEMEELMLQEELSLQKMFYMLKPFFITFKLLAEQSKHLYSNMFIGGRVLTVLHEKAKSIQAMDNKALELLLALTKSASEPYFDILKMWIYYGQISDPKQEFFIVDTKHFCLGTSAGAAAPGSAGGRGNSIFDSDDDDDEFDEDFGKFGVNYWDLRYRIDSFKTPTFLEKYEKMIYKTGKYVSIINKAKALLVKKSSRVPFPPPLHLNDQHHRHAQYQAARMEMMESNYSFDDLLRGVASMQITEDPTLPDVVLQESTSFMSSNSNEMSDSFGPVIFTPKSEEIVYSFDDESTYGQPIRAAYQEASSQLLHLLMHDSQLVATFNAVKHYLLLSKGDFMVHFINFAEKDLGCKRTDSVVQHRLDSMMGKAVGNSVAASDVSLLKNGGPHVEFTGKSFLGQIDKIMMKPLDLMDLDSSNSLNFLKKEFDDDEDDDQEEANKKAKLYCYESLALKFDVPFPLSLIFTPKSTVCYQLMFRYVFLCRYAEMELEDTWKNNNVLNVQLKQCDLLAKSAEKDGLEPEDSVRNLVSAFKNVHKKAFVLRYKMIAFVRNYHYFYALEVIEPLCGQFISQLNPKRGTSLDSVIECHEKFLERCFSSTSLTSLEITSIVINIFMLCIELSHALKESNDPDTSMMESSCFFGRSQTHNPYSTMDSKSRDSLNDAPESKSTLDSQLHEKLREIVEKANREFDSLVAKLLEKIYSDNCGQYHMMYPFVARLDFNDFYGSKISA